MSPLLDKAALARSGIDAASTVTSAGFSAAKFGTRLGFSITRGIASTAVGLTGSAFDRALFGGNLGAGAVLGGAVATALSFVEQLALLPLEVGEGLTSTSLVAAHGTVNALAALYPGSDEASFSLAAFVQLVRREWREPVLRAHLPEAQHGPAEVAAALVAWGALQGATGAWKEGQWLRYVRELDVRDPALEEEPRRARRESRVRVNSDVILPGNSAQVLTADIGDARAGLPAAGTRSRRRPLAQQASMPVPLSHAELKATLRRLSKLVLAGYGGASLTFFGVAPGASWGPTAGAAKQAEEANLAQAIDASEAEAVADRAAPAVTTAPPPEYSWWDVLLGRHDHDIFHAAATTPSGEVSDKAKARARTASVVAGNHQLMPRFWVLTDHEREEVVLVIRGTMSLNELAVDLTCDPAEFEPAVTPPRPKMSNVMPGTLFPEEPTAEKKPRTPRPRFQVHGGMLRMSKVMGAHGRPVHVAVKDALRKNKGYDLVLCGHSLGAGVAALLGLTWADPKTCLTVPSSGLPPNRRVSVYCIASPCIADPALSALSARLIVSFVYSHDIVSRLSLGSIRDLTRAAMWLCDAPGNGEGYGAVTKRALKYKAGFGTADDPEWFLAMRKTLEANMQMADLFPPGRVWWALRDGDLHPSNRTPGAGGGDHANEKLRLFEVLDVEKVFSQIVFSTDMLSSHLPHQYDRVLHSLL